MKQALSIKEIEPFARLVAEATVRECADCGKQMKHAAKNGSRIHCCGCDVARTVKGCTMRLNAELRGRPLADGTA